MEKSKSVKASILAIITLIVVTALWHPTVARAQTLKKIRNSFMANTLMKKDLNVNEKEETPLN